MTPARVKVDINIFCDELDTAQKKLIDGVVEGLTGRRPIYGPGNFTLVMGEPLSAALLGDRFTTIEACNGLRFVDGPCIYVPTVSPEALFGHEDGLLLFGQAVANSQFAPTPVDVPEPDVLNSTAHPLIAPLIAVDTEGTPENPICLTWSDGVGRYMADDTAKFWKSVKSAVTKVAYHNAVWDWSVMEAMGIEKPWEIPYADTMEEAYLTPGEPRGLKDLGYRRLGIKMTDFQDVVMPHYSKLVLQQAECVVNTHSTLMTRSGKGKLLKKPKVTVAEEYQPLARALKTKNVKLLAQRMGWWDGKGFGAEGSRVPSLSDVPHDVLLDYATLDAFVTWHLAFRNL